MSDVYWLTSVSMCLKRCSRHSYVQVIFQSISFKPGCMTTNEMNIEQPSSCLLLVQGLTQRFVLCAQLSQMNQASNHRTSLSLTRLLLYDTKLYDYSIWIQYLYLVCAVWFSSFCSYHWHTTLTIGRIHAKLAASSGPWSMRGHLATTIDA